MSKWNESLIKAIEALCNTADESAAMTIKKIKERIRDAQAPDFSKIKDGEHFTYHGVEFVRLGLEQGGVLCITAKTVAALPFDKGNCDDWRASSLRKYLNADFLVRLDEADLLPYTSDLTTDNGDTSYGKCTDMVGLLSCDLYRKYHDTIPVYDGWVWTCTPWICKHSGSPTPWNAHRVRIVHTSGALYSIYADSGYGAAAACVIFRP